MKFALPRSLAFPALSCALILPVILGACGDEAAPPIITGASGAQTTGGSTVIPGGSGGMPNATAGSGTNPTAGTGVVPTGGTGIVASGGSAGAPSTGGTGGTGTSAGTTSGGSSMAGMSSAGTSSAGGGNDAAIADSLNGQMLKGPCLSDFDPLVCKTGNCPPADDPDFALSGVLTTDKTITIGGDPAKIYNITLHIQGEVEAKSYGTTGDQEKSKPSPMADGFQVGGSPTKGDAYNVYMLRVTAPKQDYFFNALVPPGRSDHTTYGIDYVGVVKANGGTTIRLVAADRNCSMIKNCGPNNNGGTCNAPITIANVDPVAKAKNPTFNFTDPYNGQWVSIVVTSVVAN
jgi:hypothetical protein